MPALVANIRDVLDEHREPLLRYAVLHLRDRDLAEDLVQETLLSAIQSADRFRGDSSARTWLISILKHKIIDHARKAARTRVTRVDTDDVNDGAGCFDDQGRWGDARSPAWSDPAQALANAQFWGVFQACCNQLPPQTARVFLLREVMGLSVEDICKDLEFSASHCSVILYRARLRLRDCLQRKWFAGAR